MNVYKDVQTNSTLAIWRKILSRTKPTTKFTATRSAPCVPQSKANLSSS